MINEFAVGVMGEDVVIQVPVPRRLTKRQALNLAVWLAVLASNDAGEHGGTFDQMLHEAMGEG